MAVNSQGPVLINGELTRNLDATDRGLQYGHGVFTTLTVKKGIPLFLGRHLARLKNDAECLQVPFPNSNLLSEEAHRIAANATEGVMKIILTRGVGGRGYRSPKDGQGTRILSLHPFPDYPNGIRETGVKARFCELRLGINPRLAGIKHLNRLEQVLARSEWDDDEILEGLMLDHEGFLIEGVSSNVFINFDGRLITPLLDRCGVAGVMRAKVMEGARLLGLTVEERRIAPDELARADEVFLTNSVIGIWPVRSLSGMEFQTGRMARTLLEWVEAQIAKELPCA